MSFVNIDDCVREEYETQYWGFSCNYFTDEVKEITLENCENSVNMLKETLMKKITHENKQRLNLSVEQLVGKYVDALRKHSPSLDMLLREYFQIPQHVLLPQNQAQEQQFTKEELNSIDDEMSALKMRYRKAYILSLRHTEELKALDCISNMEYQCKDFRTDCTDKNSMTFKSKCNGIIDYCENVMTRKTRLVPVKRKLICGKYRVLKKRYQCLNVRNNKF